MTPVPTRLVPADVSRTEALVVYSVLDAVRSRVLTGKPSGQVIDQAMREALEMGVKLNRPTASVPSESCR